MNELELRVSQAQTRLGALSRALHGMDFWEIVVGAQRVRAQRTVYDGGVAFEAFVGELPEHAVLSLEHLQDAVLTQPFVRPADFDGWVTWELALDEHARR